MHLQLIISGNEPDVHNSQNRFKTLKKSLDVKNIRQGAVRLILAPFSHVWRVFESISGLQFIALFNAPQGLKKTLCLAGTFTGVRFFGLSARRGLRSLGSNVPKPRSSITFPASIAEARAVIILFVSAAALAWSIPAA
jgi:hypothetical protein